MTKKNLKDLVKQIQKIAEPPPPRKPGYVSSGLPKGTGGGTGAAPGHRALPGHGGRSTAPQGGTGGYGGNTAIMTMQHALQDLAQTVSSQINLQQAFSSDPRTRDEAKARDAFGVFLAKNYMRNTQVPGVEFDPNEGVTDVSKKSPTDPTRLSVVMDTMNRIGNPKKGERFVDGDWGPRTNAAVRDTYAFASGLFQFVNDVNRFATRKLEIKSYQPSRLADLEKYAQVDPKALSPQQKAIAAPEVTKHVKDIQKMYEEVKNNILQHKAYQQFIEGNRAFKSYAKVTPQQINAVKKQFPQGIDVNVAGIPTKINVDDLLSLKALEAWIDRAVPNLKQQGKVTPEIVVSSIWKQYEKLIGTPDMGY